MRRLRLWMRIVGGFYIVLGVVNSPPVMAARMDIQYPFLDLPPDSLAIKAIIDLWFVFGVETAVIGLMLLFGSAVPVRNRILAQTVVVLELFRILLDLFWIGRGYYDIAPYIIWIGIHLAIIISGWRILQQAETGSELDAGEPDRQTSNQIGEPEMRGVD